MEKSEGPALTATVRLLTEENEENEGGMGPRGGMVPERELTRWSRVQGAIQISQNQPLSPALSPLVPHGEREML